MRKRRIGLFVLAPALAIVGLWWWQARSSFSAHILSARRAICEVAGARRHPCVISLGDAFPGEWDRVIVFDMAADQDEVDHAIGQHVKRPDLRRFIVFMQGSRVVRTMSESQGVEHPLSGEVVFSRVPQVNNHITIDRGWVFWFGGSEDCNGCSTLVRLLPGEGFM